MRVLRLLFLLPALFLLLQACSESPEAPLRLGTNVWPGYEPLYLGQQLNLIDREAIRLIEYPSASEVIRAFRNRALDAAALTLDEVLLLQQDGIPVSVILVLDISNGGDVIMARQEIADMSGLKGRRVAVESGALGAYVISRALEIHGLTLADIEVKHLEVSAHEDAYRDGVVDAAVTFEPVRTQLLNQGAHELFSSREMPGEIVDVLVVHSRMLEQQPQRLRALIAGWFATLAELQQQPGSSAALIAQRLRVTPAEVIAGYQGLELPSREENRQLLSSRGPLHTTIERLSATMQKNGLLRSTSAPATLLVDDLAQ
jgi:NitT/TauT family transport system substrate-binding protein